jgi:hypothetical protein
MTDNGRNRIKDWESLTQSLEKSSESAVLKEPHPIPFMPGGCQALVKRECLFFSVRHVVLAD